MKADIAVGQVDHLLTLAFKALPASDCQMSGPIPDYTRGVSGCIQAAYLARVISQEADHQAGRRTHISATKLPLATPAACKRASTSGCPEQCTGCTHWDESMSFGASSVSKADLHCSEAPEYPSKAAEAHHCRLWGSGACARGLMPLHHQQTRRPHNETSPGLQSTFQRVRNM